MDCGGGGVQRLVSGPDNSIRDVVQKRGCGRSNNNNNGNDNIGMVGNYTYLVARSNYHKAGSRFDSGHD